MIHITTTSSMYFENYPVLHSTHQYLRKKLIGKLSEKCHLTGGIHLFMQYSEVFPKNLVFVMVNIWLLVFMNILPENHENWYTGWKKSKYDSQIALRAVPDYEPLSTPTVSLSGISCAHCGMCLMACDMNTPQADGFEPASCIWAALTLSSRPPEVSRLRTRQTW